MQEFSDSKRYVKNPPAIIYHDNKFPENIAAMFPNATKEKFTNGVISFSKCYNQNLVVNYVNFNLPKLAISSHSYICPAYINPSYIALFENHVKPNFDQPLTFLIGFRQYLHYHFHAIKASLHTKMRKRVETFQRVLTKAKREQDGPKVYKDTHGGALVSDIKEERKQEEVFNYRQ